MAITFDTAAAQAFKDEQDAAIKAKEDQAAALTGKDNKKARTELSKEASAMKTDSKYIDAIKVLKGLEAPHGNFMTKAEDETAKEAAKEEKKEAVKEKEKKDDKKPKKAVESAGISKAERDELEKLKTDIIAKKAELKAQGLSGGQCNKDEEVVRMVARMQELKIKEDPTSADAGKKKDDKKEAKKADSEEKMNLKNKIEEYRQQLISEFGYSAKDIKADPDMNDMQARLAKLK